MIFRKKYSHIPNRYNIKKNDRIFFELILPDGTKLKGILGSEVAEFLFPAIKILKGNSIEEKK